MKRDWTAAVAAHEGCGCRVCLRWPRELAHVLPRTFDRARGRMHRVKVHPLAVVPLCQKHHHLYDAHQLNLLPHLTEQELQHAISRVGKGQALRRIGGRSAVVSDRTDTADRSAV